MIKVTREDFLNHFGVPGMRWGKKRAAKIASESSNDSKRKDELKGKKLHQLSNAELRDLTTRLQLESQYKQLTASKKSLGRKIVEEVLINYAKGQATVFVGKYAAKGIKQLAMLKK